MAGSGLTSPIWRAATSWRSRSSKARGMRLVESHQRTGASGRRSTQCSWKYRTTARRRFQCAALAQRPTQRDPGAQHGPDGDIGNVERTGSPESMAWAGTECERAVAFRSASEAMSLARRCTARGRMGSTPRDFDEPNGKRRACGCKSDDRRQQNQGSCPEGGGAAPAQSGDSSLTPDGRPGGDGGARRARAPAPDLGRTGDAVDSTRGRSVEATVLTTLALLYTLYFAREFLVPIVFALLLNFLLSPFIRRLRPPAHQAAGQRGDRRAAADRRRR